MRVQIAIDTFDDIFSDFDIRDYKERYISSDFLNELRMRTYKMLNRKNVIICLLIPGQERNGVSEKIIEKRLKDFFKNRYIRNQRRKKEIMVKTIYFECIGILFLFVALFLSKYTFEYFKEFMLIPSWFFVWNGLEKYFDHKKIIDKKITYYSFVSKSSILFEDSN